MEETYKKLQSELIKLLRKRLDILELKEIIKEIKYELKNLNNIIWTKEDIKLKDECVSFLDARMQGNVFYTIKNIENYQHDGWKDLMF
ncbi:MAG TPA: hypothetical protein DCE02_00105 [Ruminiclostridium sp.]|uniref:Uncharacterized protein n=1 Tax=Acetivibrio saccincola TaxID=1677857 RepID=A0A2K9E3E1_9FIRM|nr:hypothetical protein [Acetivibrio saccincola]HAA42397.1 hypothetical protein [Ruminiclostridium sp.]AUG57889.1 hypothetical protein HVS_09960 [Acetivibrio saccincola]NLW27510.1 hypothetical protein [Acetivibrio saccincola]PQQ67786.1 hypothetical protein B9R14_14195 [Acetivibrio saccincola]HOA97115.1 hypothetical protein [Acetivibrio saccincola]